MRSILLFAVFLAVLLASPCLALQAVLVGTQNLAGNDIQLTSTGLPTVVTFTESSAASAVTLRVSATFQTTISNVLSVQSGSVTLNVPSGPLATVPQGTTKAPTSSSSMLAAMSIPTYIGASAIAHRRFGVAAVASLVALALAPLPSYAAAADDHHLEIEIIFPVEFTFNSINLNLAYGSSVSSAILRCATSITITESATATTTASVSRVTLWNVTAASLNIQVNGPVDLTNLYLPEPLSTPPSTLLLNILSRNSNVKVSAPNGFRALDGVISVSFVTGATVTSPSNCTETAPSAGKKDLKCGGTQTSTTTVATITAAGSIEIVFGVVQTAAPTTTPAATTLPPVTNEACLQFATTDTFVTASPPVPANYGGNVWDLNAASNWFAVQANWSAINITETAANGLSFKTYNWNSDVFGFLMAPGVILPVGLHPQRLYRFKFSVSQNASNSKVAVDLNYTARVWALKDYGENYPNASRIMSSPWGTPGDKEVIAQSTAFSPGVVPSGSWSAQTWEFRPSALGNRAFIGVMFGNGGSGGGQYFFKDLSFELVAEAATPPTLFTVNSAAVASTIPVMSPPADFGSTTRTNCPHLQTGLKRWEDAATWGGSVPAASTPTITLPASTKVLVTSCSFAAGDQYTEIVVPDTSELIFGDAQIALNVRTIRVFGAMRIGSPTCRLYSPITITFFGTRAQAGTDGKGIVVDTKGTLEMFGKLYHPTWTRLAAPVRPGDDRASLQQSVNWEVGQKVVLVTSYMRDGTDDLNMNEVMEIAAVSGSTVQFTTRAQWYHHAGVEYQSEVGLLSRRITLQGDSTSPNEQFGGHVMIMGQGRVSGVRFYRMGQFNTLARYPLHFHLMGSAPTSYMTDNAVQDSFFRCYTIHGTHDSLVTRNVAYNTTGHCYYMEDGVEENNTISYNLAARVAYIPPLAPQSAQFMDDVVTSTDRILPADFAAAGFYISNTWNTVQGNAASGGWACFALPLFEVPTGQFKGIAMNPAPKDKAIKLFDGNTAHSSGYLFQIFGGCLYIGGRLFYNNADLLTYNGGRSLGSAAKNPKMWVNGALQSTQANLTNFRAWLCGQGGNHWGNDVIMTNSDIYDSGRGVTLFGPALLQHSIIGHTSNPLPYPTRDRYPWPYGGGVQGFQFYDVWSQAILYNVTFKGFKRQTSFPLGSDPSGGVAALSVLQNQQQNSLNQGISAVSKITYVDCDDSVKYVSTDQKTRDASNVQDWDGSVSGVTGGALIGSNTSWWKIGSDCTYRSDWYSWICPKTTAREICHLYIDVPNFLDGNLIPSGGNGTTRAGTFTVCGSDANNKVNLYYWQAAITGISGEGWYLYFDDRAGNPVSFTITPARVPVGNKVVVAMSYPTGTTFNIWYDYKWDNRVKGNYTLAADKAAVAAAASRFVYYWDNTNGWLYFTVHTFKVQSTDFTAQGVTVYSINGDSAIHIDATCASPVNSFCPVAYSLPPSIYA